MIGMVKDGEKEYGLMATKRVLWVGVGIGSRTTVHHTRANIVVDITDEIELVIEKSHHSVRDILGCLLLGGTIGTNLQNSTPSRGQAFRLIST